MRSISPPHGPLGNGCRLIPHYGLTRFRISPISNLFKHKSKLVSVQKAPVLLSR